MVKKAFLIVVFGIFLNACANKNTTPIAVGKLLEIEPYLYTNGNDSLMAELGTFEVPAIRKPSQNRKLKLKFMRINAVHSSNSTAIFFLEGGPGAPAIKQSRFDLYKKLSFLGDVIVLDQRGTGMSEDNIECPITARYEIDQPITAELSLKIQSEIAKECRKHFAEIGIDLNAYNAIESAKDVNELREALGYEKMNLVGMSYGTHLGLAIIRHFEDYVDKAIFAGLEGYDHTYKLPSTFDRNLKTISDLMAQDTLARKKFPDFERFVKKTVKELNEHPKTVEIDIGSTKEKIVVTGFLFKKFVSGMFGRKQFISTILSDFGPINEGDYTGFARGTYEAYYNRDISLNPVSHCMDCSSGVSEKRLERIKSEIETSIFKDAVNFVFPDICAAWGIIQLPGDFREPIYSEIPILFITGDLDGRTPKSNVEDIIVGLPNNSHLIIENMGHNTNGLFLEIEEVMINIEKFVNGNFKGNYTYTSPAIEFE